MKTKKVYTDGWDCVPELKEASDTLETIEQDLYEIRLCQRSSRLVDLVEQIKSACQDAIDELENINTDVEFETIYDDE